MGSMVGGYPGARLPGVQVASGPGCQGSRFQCPSVRSGVPVSDPGPSVRSGVPVSDVRYRADYPVQVAREPVNLTEFAGLTGPGIKNVCFPRGADTSVKLNPHLAAVIAP